MHGAIKSSCAFLMVLACAACGDVSETSSVTKELAQSDRALWEEYWESARWYGVSEAYPANDAAQQVAQSDVVLVGRFKGVCQDRTVTGDVDVDRFTIACLDVAVSQVLKGSVEEDVISLELFGAPADHGGALPGGQMILFLIEGTGPESGRYGVINSAGLVTSTTRGEIDLPLSATAPDGESPPFRELTEVGTLEEFTILLQEVNSG